MNPYAEILVPLSEALRNVAAADSGRLIACERELADLTVRVAQEMTRNYLCGDQPNASEKPAL